MGLGARWSTCVTVVFWGVSNSHESVYEIVSSLGHGCSVLRLEQLVASLPVGRPTRDLGFIQATVHAPLAEQVLVGSHLGDAPILEDDDPVRIHDRGEAVTDHDHRPLPRQSS